MAGWERSLGAEEAEGCVRDAARDGDATLPTSSYLTSRPSRVASMCQLLGRHLLPLLGLFSQVVSVSDADADIRIECLADRYRASGNQWQGYTLHDLGLPSLGALDFTVAFPRHVQLGSCCQKIQLRFTAHTLRSLVPETLENEGGYFVPNVEWTLCTTDTRLFNCYGYNDMPANKLQDNEIDAGLEVTSASSLTGRISTTKPLSGSWWFVLQHCLKPGSSTANYEVGTFSQAGLSAVSAPRYSGEAHIKPLADIHVPRVEVSSVSPCLVEGHIDSRQQWFGYLATMAVPRDSSISFRFLFKEAEPSNEALLTVLFYSEQDIRSFSESDNCKERVRVLMSQANTHKVLPLSIGNVWSGCAVESVNGTPTYTCEGGRNVDEAHTVYIAVANCDRASGLPQLYYFFEFQNYESDCPSVVSNSVEMVSHPAGSAFVFLRTFFILLSLFWHTNPRMRYLA